MIFLWVAEESAANAETVLKPLSFLFLSCFGLGNFETNELNKVLQLSINSSSTYGLSSFFFFLKFPIRYVTAIVYYRLGHFGEMECATYCIENNEAEKRRRARRPQNYSYSELEGISETEQLAQTSNGWECLWGTLRCEKCVVHTWPLILCSRHMSLIECDDFPSWAWTYHDIHYHKVRAIKLSSVRINEQIKIYLWSMTFSKYVILQM